MDFIWVVHGILVVNPAVIGTVVKFAWLCRDTTIAKAHTQLQTLGFGESKVECGVVVDLISKTARAIIL
jgi:hypothetical protein